MISKTHPYWHVREVVRACPDVVSVPFSYYSYSPQTIADSRASFEIPSETFTDERQVYQILKDTPPNHEMAIHSNLRLADDRRRHLVMVDMSTTSKAHLEKLRTFLGDDVFKSITWYASGRSFHGYGGVLLRTAEWVQFMGLLLLANQPKLEPTVDPRWIGHRLLGGYSALRWTRNTPHYLAFPKRIELDPKVVLPRAPVAKLGTRFVKRID